jgi:hypothetical protein
LKDNNYLALIVTYYLSRFDRFAYQQLGYGSMRATHAEIGRRLNVKANSVKNMRDEFDSIHDNPRAGWYQRPLRPSRARVVEAFQNLSVEDLHDVVLEILSDPQLKGSQDLAITVEAISKEKKGEPVFIIRGPTGRKAEEFFQSHHQKNMAPVPGKLIDCRDLGCGYDFEIRNNGRTLLIEVKGTDGDTGGIVFTSKEWLVAQNMEDSYILAIVRNVSSTPSIRFIRNPASVLHPRKSIFTTVQVSWSVSNNELSSAPDSSGS